MFGLKLSRRDRVIFSHLKLWVAVARHNKSKWLHIDIKTTWRAKGQLMGATAIDHVVVVRLMRIKSVIHYSLNDYYLINPYSAKA